VAGSVITVDNLSKHFALKDGRVLKVLDNISFSVPEGEMLGIIGANGSGKSTLLKVLSGVLKPTSGDAVISGTYSSILDVGSGFHPDLNGIDNIKLRAELIGQKGMLTKDVMDQIVEFSGLREFIHEPVKNYSSGMFVRLAFSILIFLHHDIVLVDEVLSAGDLEFQNQLLKSGFLYQSSGIMVSHELDAVAEYCNRIMVLGAGKILELTDAETAISNYHLRSSSGTGRVLLNKEALFPDVALNGRLRIDSISMLNRLKDERVLTSDSITFSLNLSSICEYTQDIVLIPFVRTLGRKVDLHADSPYLRKDGDVLKIEPLSKYELKFTYPEQFFARGHYCMGLIIATPEGYYRRWEDLALFTISGEQWELEKLTKDLFLQVKTPLNWELTKF
jgi:ABC-type polysaccharide/polyol phosphate transport system ATPase subunit